MDVIKIGPMKLACSSMLRGWYTQISGEQNAYYGTLDTQSAIDQTLADPQLGLVMYIPFSGVTRVFLPTHIDIFIIKPGNVYFYSADAGPYQAQMSEAGSYAGLKIFFSLSNAASINTSFAKLYLSDPSRPLFWQMPISANDIASSISLDTPKTKGAKYLNSALQRLVDQLISRCAAFENTQDLPKKPSWKAQIEAADQYLKSHIISPPTIVSLANLVGLNHMTMKRGFNKMFTQTVYGRLRYWRIEQAKNLLAQGNSVTYTAMEVGFSNPSKFSVAFRRATQFNPSVWQQRKLRAS